MNLFYIFSILLFLNTNISNDNVNSNDCIRKEDMGSVKICIPNLVGMTECYYNPIVKEKADKFDLAGNQILGFYLNESTYKQVESINEIAFDDYVKVYSPKSISELSLEYNEFEQLSKMMSSNFILKKWSDIEKEINDQLGSLKIDQPTIIENSKINNAIRNIIVLTTIDNGDKTTTMLCSLNMLYIQKRVVFLAYYKFYEGSETLEKLKTKNRELVLSFYEKNGL
jgi:hypothetical protein